MCLVTADTFYVSAVAMVKFLKSGKVVLVLNGRFAGRKAVIVKVRLPVGSTRVRGFLRVTVYGMNTGFPFLLYRIELFAAATAVNISVPARLGKWRGGGGAK